MAVRFGPVTVDSAHSAIVASIEGVHCAALADEARSSGADIIEARLDRMSELQAPGGIEASPALLDGIRAAARLPLLATIRSAAEGGAFDQEESLRLAWYRRILPHVDAVDVELQATAIRGDVVAAARQAGKAVLLSFHDFSSCPDDDGLETLIEEGFAAGASLVKLAVTPHSRDDVIRLLLLTHRNATRDICIIAMGRAGRVSRLVFPYFGSRLTYGCVRDEEVAPGQIPVARMKALMALF